MERFLETTWGPAEKQPPLNTLQHSLNGFQQCESFICETPKEIASSCHCKRGNLRHAQCNYSHWELPKPTRVAPHCCEEKKNSCRISTAVCGQDFDVPSPLSTALPCSSPSASLPGPPSATGEHPSRLEAEGSPAKQPQAVWLPHVGARTCAPAE